jgi:hypothetical protein
MRFTITSAILAAILLAAGGPDTIFAQWPLWPASPAAGIYLPDGDPVKGRIAFTDLRCNTCHRIPADGIEQVVQGTLGPELGSKQAVLSKEQLATSIIAPSHNVAFIDKKWRSGDVSRMGDFNQAMTVRQLIDMVAYLRTLRK